MFTDNACFLFPQVALNNFRILTRELVYPQGIHYHAYLLKVDLSSDDESEREDTLNLLNTEAAQQPLKTPVAALAVLMLVTSSRVHASLMANPL